MTNRRWLLRVLEEVEEFDVILPWERRADRRAWRRHLEQTRRFRFLRA